MTVFTRTGQFIAAPADINGEPRQVDNQEMQVWMTEVETVVNAFTSNGGVVYSSKAAMDADLSLSSNRMAWAIGDPVAANNGIYRKTGGPGAGSWIRVGDLPYSFIVASDVGAGTPNFIQAATVIPVSSSALIWMNVFEANTSSPVTVSFNGGAALTIKSNTGADIAVGGLVSGMIVMGVVSGATFRLVSDQASSAIVAQAEAAALIATAAAASLTARVSFSVNLLDYTNSEEQRNDLLTGAIYVNSFLDAAMADAVARGIKVVDIPEGHFHLAPDSYIVNPGCYLRGQPGGTYIYKNGSGRAFVTLGNAPDTATEGYALTANALASAVTVTMSTASAANFITGTRAILWANIATASTSARDAEFVWITNVNAGTGVITFASPIHFAYATVNTAKLFNVDLIEGVGYENLIIDWTNGTQTTPQRPPYRVDEVIVSWFCLKPRFINIETKNTINETISLHGCVDAYVRTLKGVNGFSDAVDLPNAFSYGIHEQGVNVGLIATDLHFERHRHGYTTGAPDSSDPSMFNGGHPIGSVISNGVHRWAKAAGWDTHDIGIDIWFDNLFTEGGFQAGMQIRTTRAHVVDCGASDIQAYGGVPGHGLYLVGGDANNLWARDTRIDGFEAYNVAGAGIRDQSPGTIAKNIVVEKAQSNAISWDGGSSGDGEYSDIYAKDVAKNPALGGAYAVSLGNAANQKSARIRDMFVDDPNNNLSALVRRTNTATDKLEITNVRGLNASKVPIDVFFDATSAANATIRGGYGASGNNVGPINTLAIASDSINADSLYAAGAVLLPQTATADALVTITGGERDGIILLWGSSGNTITLTHGTGTDNLFLRGASNVNLLNNQGIALMRRGAVWIELWRTF